MMNQLESKVKDYFTFWEQKEIGQLSKLLDSEIVLQDWDNFVVGKQAVTKFNSDFFDSVNLLSLDILSIFFEENTSFTELVITIDETQLTVLDKIVFNKKGFITNIRAYKG